MMKTILPQYFLVITLTNLSPLVLAGNLEPPTSPTEIGSAMYSIDEICQRLKSGAGPNLTPFSEPTSGPGTSTRCTLNDVMAVAPK